MLSKIYGRRPIQDCGRVWTRRVCDELEAVTADEVIEALQADVKMLRDAQRDLFRLIVWLGAIVTLLMVHLIVVAL